MATARVIMERVNVISRGLGRCVKHRNRVQRGVWVVANAIQPSVTANPDILVMIVPNRSVLLNTEHYLRVIPPAVPMVSVHRKVQLRVIVMTDIRVPRALIQSWRIHMIGWV